MNQGVNAKFTVGSLPDDLHDSCLFYFNTIDAIGSDQAKYAIGSEVLVIIEILKKSCAVSI
jgi:hypothetical protein